MASAHLDRLAACLNVPLSRRTLRRLQQCERLHARLHALMVERWEGQIGDDPELGAGHAGTQDPPPSLLEHPDVYEVARLAGAVWHSRSLKSLVSGTVVGELVNRIGRRAHAFGLRNLALAVEPTVIPDPAELATAIERDGLKCLGAGFAGGRPALRLRFLARLPPGTPAEADTFPDRFLQNAGPILSRVAAELNETGHVA